MSDPTALTNASVHMSVNEVKQQIHESRICYLAIKMAQTGKRPIFTEDIDGEPEIVKWQEMSEAAHIDMIKFIVRKVLPDAKEVVIADKKASLDHWAGIIAADGKGG